MATQLGIGQPLSGTIFTTTAACAAVRVTQFENKSDVFVQSGPDERGNRLPPGIYFVQVTDPSGFLLGGPRTSVNVGEQGFCAQLESLTARASNGLPGFDDTPNPGGEYKVWISPNPAFPPSESKTANFKVRAEPLGAISGQVFYDADTNGLPSGGLERGIAGWKVVLSGPIVAARFTDAMGQFRFENLRAGLYRLQAVPPPVGRWISTVPTERMVSITARDTVVGNDFAFVCLGTGGAMPREFWTSSSGLGLLTLTDAAFLNTRPPFARPHPNAPPSATPFSTSDLDTFRTQVKSFLDALDRSDLRYWLAAELLVLELNARRGLIVPSGLIYAPGHGFMNVLPGLESQAIQAWLTGSALDQFIEILANVNANQSFVQLAACSFPTPY
jgi:hypothetical protein